MTAWWYVVRFTAWGRRCSGFGYTNGAGGAFCSAATRSARTTAELVSCGFAPMVGGQVKERLTGAIILVALIVLLVPELLSGPVRSATRAATPASSSEEPPLRSYTINLTDDAHGRAGAAAANGPQQPAPLAQTTAPATGPGAPS